MNIGQLLVCTDLVAGRYDTAMKDYCTVGGPNITQHATVNVYTYWIDTVLAYLIYNICSCVKYVVLQKMSARMHCECMDDVKCAFVYLVMV